MQHQQDEKFMQTALSCAVLGRGSVEPNPMVGAVLIRDGVEIARGYHERFGARHAEIVALDAARLAGKNPAGATMYVTLEPCSHHGKTPPCANAIIDAKIARVVVAIEDPDEKVSGRGIAMLQNAGIDVTVGICAESALELLASYIKLRTKHLPWVICKWAQTADGYLTLGDRDDRWISSKQSRADVHKLRSLVDGVLVGSGTALADDPLLTNRISNGSQPARLVCDSKLIINPESKLITTANISPVIIATTSDWACSKKADRLRDFGVEVLSLPTVDAGIDLGALLTELGNRCWSNLLVEAGPTLLDSFISESLADELLVYIAPINLSGDQSNTPHFDIARLSKQIALPKPTQTTIGTDTRLRYILHPASE